MTLIMAEKKQNIIQTVKEYGQRLFGFIRGRVPSDEDAEDILQDVWYQLINQPETEMIESVSGWLYRVARNKITDTYRKKRTAPLTGTDSDEDEEWMVPAFMTAAGNDPETFQLKRLFHQSMVEALEELPAAQRNVFIWNELEDRTLQEIADREGENIKTIISRKRYAVQHLRNRLAFLYDEFLND
jgi:RNA polymerase sigma factor (sigma-70 family)